MICSEEQVQRYWNCFDLKRTYNCGSTADMYSYARMYLMGPHVFPTPLKIDKNLTPPIPHEL